MSIQQSTKKSDSNKKKIKVLVVDDSALVREILAKGLAMDPELEVVGRAANPYIARDMIIQHKPDVLTLDVEMPRMDGVEFLRRLMPQYPLPVLVVSALTEKGKKVTIDALEAGAIDFVTKPSVDVSRGLVGMLSELREKVKVAASANVSSWKKKTGQVKQTITADRSKALAESTDKVIAIGASTGGTEAVRQVVNQFPITMPGAVIVLHMPAGFTRMYAERLDAECVVSVKEAEDGDRVMMGRVLIAPGDFQMSVRRSGGIYQVKCYKAEKVNRHAPSVEVLFQSVAQYVGSNAIGVMLTGMGSDGASGLLAMRKGGARTLAQDEATSVVFGMPKVAYELGGAESLVPINHIAQRIMNLLTERN